MKQYLEKANPIVERLIIDLLIEMPDDLIEFSKNWFQTKGKKIESGELVKSSIKKEPKGPQIDVNETSNYSWNKNPNEVSMHSQKNMVQYAGINSDEEEDEPYDEQAYDEMEEKSKKQKKGQRSGVSAEVYGVHNVKKDYVPKVIEKSEEVKQRIMARLNQAFMFKALEDKDRDIVLNAMEECRYNVGDSVIEQGADGDVLYVVDEGQLDCFKRFNRDSDEETYLKTYEPGESFGELALLYNAPRAATIRAKTEAVLFSLDRECFNGIVKDAAQKRRERFDNVLQKVELLSNMDPYERTQLCDGLQHMAVQENQTVITQGEVGDNFYIVESGTLKAMRKMGEDSEEE